MEIRRADLEGPRVRVLNLGGVANADVLEVAALDGHVAIVKDYGARSPWVRAWLAPALVRRELALLERVAGAPGVPASLGRIDALALALERIEGAPLRRRTHAGSLSPGFFAALEAVLEALRVRGVVYADLRSPTNVLCTPERAPALVDLASAIRFPAPRLLVRAFYRRALAKLRARFEGTSPTPLGATEMPGVRDLRAGRDRIRTLDVGPVGDPVPAIVLPDTDASVESLRSLLQEGAAFGRRVLGIELPVPRGQAPAPAAGSLWLERALRALRVPVADVVAFGQSGRVGRDLARRAPQRVRALLSIDLPDCLVEATSCPVPWLAARTQPGHSPEAGSSAAGPARACWSVARLESVLWKELTAFVRGATV